MEPGGPIFIGGLSRSGKTYLRMMLAAHPGLAFSRRTNMWTHFYRRYGDLSRSDNFERCLEAMLRHKHIARLNPDPVRIRRAFSQGAPTYSRLFALVHEHYAGQQGKSRWGDQTESVERLADPIFTAYPGAKMIHLLRDPRDQYAAFSPDGGRGKGKAGLSAARWLSSAAIARRNQEKYPRQYLIVRYEEMVSQPEEILRKVCDFLSEDFFPEMLTLENVARFQNRPGSRAGSGQSPLTPQFIGNYRQMISKQEIAIIQKFAGAEMEAYGYPFDPLNFSSGEKLRFSLVDFPINLARRLVSSLLVSP